MNRNISKKSQFLNAQPSDAQPSADKENLFLQTQQKLISPWNLS